MRSIKLLLFLSVILLLSSCRQLGFYGSYKYSFVGVSNYNLTDTVQVTNSAYSDSLISIKWAITDGWGFDFELTNNTDEEIEIDWRKVSFISPGGNISRSAVDYNSFIPPMSSMSQRMRWARFTPVSLVNLESYNYNIWATYKIIEIRPTHDIEVRNAWKEVLGTPFSVYFPMKIKGKEYNYRFLFEVSSLHVNQQAPRASYDVMKGEDFPKGFRTKEEIKEWKKNH